MQKIIILILVFITLTNCNGTGQLSKNDLQIPDRVTINNNEIHQQFPGTRLFMVKPKNYFLIPKLIRYQKDNNTYIQAIESSTLSFTKQKVSIKQSYEFAKKKGLIPYYEKEFILGDYEAYLIYGPDNKPNMDQMILTFGDNEFVAIIAGELPSNNDSIRKEILQSLLTTYIDKSSIPDFTELTDYTIDLSKSDFKFNSNMSQISYYTIGGKGNPINNTFENQIMIMSLPSMESKQKIKEFAISTIKKFSNLGLNISDIVTNEITINSIPAYEFTFKAEYQNKFSKNYFIILGNEKSTIQFCGSAYDNQDKLYNQFIEISKTLKIK